MPRGADARGRVWLDPLPRMPEACSWLVRGSALCSVGLPWHTALFVKSQAPGALELAIDSAELELFEADGR